MFVLRPVPHHYVVWLLLAPLLLVEMHTFDALLLVVALQDSGRARTALAQVVEHRAGAQGPEIRYQFGAGGAQYFARDGLGGSSLWVPINEAAWSEAQRSGHIRVRYLPEDPWTNQPVGLVGHPVANSICMWGLFLLLDLAWVAETIVIARNFARCQAMVERRQPYRLRFWESRRVVDRRYEIESWETSRGRT